MAKTSISIRYKGGPGSGHHGHAGRPGKLGGSVAGAGGGAVFSDGKISRVPEGWQKGESAIGEELARTIERGGSTYNLSMWHDSGPIVGLRVERRTAAGKFSSKEARMIITTALEFANDLATGKQGYNSLT